MKEKIVAPLKKTELGRLLVENQQFRIFFFAVCALCVNLLFGIFHGIVGIVTQSVWFMVLCLYYSLLGFMRFFAVLTRRKNSFAKEYRFMAKAGIWFVLLSFVLAAVNYLSLSRNIASKYSEITMITIAAYTFYKITMAVIKAVRRRKHPSPLVLTIGNISYAEVAVSVFTMQRSMLVSFGEMDANGAKLLNIFTGSSVFLFIFVLGILMIQKGWKNRGKIKIRKSQ